MKRMNLTLCMASLPVPQLRRTAAMLAFMLAGSRVRRCSAMASTRGQAWLAVAGGARLHVGAMPGLGQLFADLRSLVGPVLGGEGLPQAEQRPAVAGIVFSRSSR